MFDLFATNHPIKHYGADTKDLNRSLVCYRVQRQRDLLTRKPIPELLVTVHLALMLIPSALLT